MELTPHHKAKYGDWSGNPRGEKPDPARCAEEVWPSGWRIPSQCARKRGHGPNGAFCKQHDPDAVKRRAEEADRRHREKQAIQKRRWLVWSGGLDAVVALQKIAAGHNDPRSLAIEILTALKQPLDT